MVPKITRAPQGLPEVQVLRLEEAMNHCELCGKRLDMSEKSERMSGLCWDCQQTNPEEFEERYAAEEETYRERPEAHQ